jgi:hypothetical protein
MVAAWEVVYRQDVPVWGMRLMEQRVEGGHLSPHFPLCSLLSANAFLCRPRLGKHLQRRILEAGGGSPGGYLPGRMHDSLHFSLDICFLGGLGTSSLVHLQLLEAPGRRLWRRSSYPACTALSLLWGQRPHPASAYFLLSCTSFMKSSAEALY